MSPSQTKDEADDALKQQGILGNAVFTVKQPLHAGENLSDVTRAEMFTGEIMFSCVH